MRIRNHAAVWSGIALVGSFVAWTIYTPIPFTALKIAQLACLSLLFCRRCHSVQARQMDLSGKRRFRGNRGAVAFECTRIKIPASEISRGAVLLLGHALRLGRRERARP